MQGIRRIFVPLAVIAAVIFLLFIVNRLFFKIDPNLIQSWILSWGWWAPFIFLLMFIVRPFTLFPSSLLALAGGLAFGVRTGFLFTFTGSLLGALLSFWMAKRWGQSFVKSKWPGYTGKIQDEMGKRGFFYLIILRLLPFLGFDVVTYMAALSNVRFSIYICATVLGILPGAFAYTFLGSSVASGEFHLVMFALALLMFILMVPFFWLRKKQNR